MSSVDMSCAACSSTISESELSLACTIQSCGKRYHRDCAGGNNPSPGTWVCPECRCAQKKGGDNSLTPVGAAKKSRDPNVTLRKKIVPITSVAEPASKEADPSQLSEEVRSLRQEVSLLKDQLALAITILTSYDKKLECYSTQVQVLHNRYEQAVGVPLTKRSNEPREAASGTVNRPAEKSKPISKKIVANTQAPVAPLRPTKDILTKGMQSREGEIGSGTCEPSGTTHSLDHEPKDQQQWTEVRRSRRPASLCGTAGPTVTTLKAVEPRSYIHLWNMESNAEEICAYLRDLCPGGTCSVTELAAKGDYKSYKIGAPMAYQEICLSPEVWPVNAKIKPWIVYPARFNARKPNQPFRDGSTQNLH